MSSPSTPLPYRYPPSGPWWVATTGSDSTGDGSAANPWATIGKARDYIRANLLNVTQRADLVVNVRAGTYVAPLAFSAADSGYNGHVVHYLSYDGPGQAIISGGSTVSGWASSGPGFVADVPSQFYTMWESGNRGISARLPKLNPGASFPCSFAPYFLVGAGDVASQDTMIYSSSDFDPAAYNVSDLQVVIWPGGSSVARAWLTDTAPVASVNTGTTELTMTNPVKFIPYGGHARYFIQGVKDNWTDAGEWYLDRSGNKLYYIPVTDTSDVVIPTAGTELVQFFGNSPGTPCQNIVFEGFAVAYADYVPWYTSGYAWNDVTLTQSHPSPQPHVLDPSYDYFASQPQFHVGAVHLRHTSNVTLLNCHVSRVGMHGVYFDGYGQNNLISGCWIEQTGIDGIRFDGQYPGESYLGQLGNNIVYNTKINNVGQLSGGASAVGIANSGNNTIHYCHLLNGPRKGVWIFADYPLPASYVYASGNVIDHVLAENFCQDSGDTGAVTMTALNNSAVNTVSQTIINNTAAESSMHDVAPNGGFCDDQTNGQVWTNVNVTNQGAGAQFRQNNSSGHVLTNTSFNADGTVNGSFNPALMDTANIGTTGSFPY